MLLFEFSLDDPPSSLRRLQGVYLFIFFLPILACALRKAQDAKCFFFFPPERGLGCISLSRSHLQRQSRRSAESVPGNAPHAPSPALLPAGYVPDNRRSAREAYATKSPLGPGLASSPASLSVALKFARQRRSVSWGYWITPAAAVGPSGMEEARFAAPSLPAGTGSRRQ